MKRNQLLTMSVILAAVLTSCANSSIESAPAANPPLPSSKEESAQGPISDEKLIEMDPSTCLHGTWIADNTFFLASVRAFGDEIQSVGGQVILQFDAEGTIDSHYQDWTITASAEGHTVQIMREGIDTASYSATEDMVTITDTRIGSTITMDGAGLNMTIDPEPVSYVDATYSCTPTQASILTVDGTLELSRL